MRQAITMDELLAEYLPINRDTAYRYVREGRIPSVKCGRRVIFYRRSIEEWLEKGGV